MNLHPPKPPGTKRYWLLFKWAIFLIVIGFIVRRTIELWKSTPVESIRIQAVWLIAAGMVYLVGWLPSVWFWRATMRSMHQPLEWQDAIRAHYVGQMGKYVPGKALVLIIRGSMVKDGTVNPVLAGVTSAYETLVFMATGLMLGIAAAPYAFETTFRTRIPPHMKWLCEMPIMISLAVILITLATTPISAWLFTMMGRKTMPDALIPIEIRPKITSALISQGILIMSLGWALHALSLGFVIQSISNQTFEITDFPKWLAATTIATVGGFVILLAPGGLGVREGFLMELLKIDGWIGTGPSIIIAGLLRAIWFATEFAAATVLFLTQPRRR